MQLHKYTRESIIILMPLVTWHQSWHHDNSVLFSFFFPILTTHSDCNTLSYICWTSYVSSFARATVCGQGYKMTYVLLSIEELKFKNVAKCKYMLNSLRPSEAHIHWQTDHQDNGLLPGRCQAIIWTSTGILLLGPWRTNFSETVIKIQTISFKKMHLKMLSVQWPPFVLASMC